MRTFVAIDLSAGLLARLEAIQAELKRGFPGRGLSWTRPASIHLTLKFLGEVDEGQIGEIESALENAAEGSSPFTITARGVGAFPSLKRPRVFWVGIEANEALSVLQKKVDEALASLGFTPEKRGFSPHLTLCRVKDTAAGRLLGDKIIEAAPEVDESWEAASIVLYKSVLSPAGARYTVLKRIELKG